MPKKALLRFCVCVASIGKQWIMQHKMLSLYTAHPGVTLMNFIPVAFLQSVSAILKFLQAGPLFVLVVEVYWQLLLLSRLMTHARLGVVYVLQFKNLHIVVILQADSIPCSYSIYFDFYLTLGDINIFVLIKLLDASALNKKLPLNKILYKISQFRNI